MIHFRGQQAICSQQVARWRSARVQGQAVVQVHVLVQLRVQALLEGVKCHLLSSSETFFNSHSATILM